jgi:hypothetical protein
MAARKLQATSDTLKQLATRLKIPPDIKTLGFDTR